MTAPVVAGSTNGGSAGAAFTVTVPAGTVNGNLLIAVNASDWDTAALNGLPAGFTALTTSSYNGGNNNPHLQIGYRIASSEPGSYSFPGSSGSSNAGAILRITGANATPVIAQVAPVATLNSPSITPNGSDDLLIVTYVADTNSSGARTWTPPSGLTEQVDRNSPDLYTGMEICWKQSPSSPSGSFTGLPQSGFNKFGSTAISIKAVSTPAASGSASLSLSAAGATGARSSAAGALTLHANQTGFATSTTASLSLSAVGTATYFSYVAGVSTDGHTLVDVVGRTLIPQFDTIWPMIQQAGNTARNGGSATWQDDIDWWIDHRVSQGFNSLKCNMFGDTGNGSPNQDSRTWDSVWPFGASGSGSSLANPSTGQIEAYWQRVDYLFDRAAASGLTVFIHIFYADDVDGPGTVMDGKSTSEFQALGTFLGNRYKDRPNIVWIVGGDYFDTVTSQIGAMFTNIRATGDTHLISIQNWSDDGGHHWTTSRKSDTGTTQVLGTAWAQFDSNYIYDPTYLAASVARATSPTMPAVWYDGYYDQDSGDALTIRRFNAWSLTYGAPGVQYGSEGLWAQPSGWRTEVASPNTVVDQIIGIRESFTSYDRWPDLVPDISSTFITAGRSSGNNFVTGGITPDGHLAIIYLPNASSAITVDTTQMQAGYAVTWVDPTNGATTAGSTGTSFSKGNNAAGSTDWLLVLEGPDTAAITGAASLTLGGSGVAAGSAAASGTASLSLAASGAVKGSTSGTGALSLSASGAVAAPVAGTASLTLAGAGSAVPAAAGTGSLTLSGTGAAKAATSGTGSISLSAAGAMRAATGATASLTLSGSGATATPVAGAGSLSLTAAGSTAPVVAGSASLALSASGAATSAGTASGSAVLSLTGSISVKGATAGAALLTLGASGSSSSPVAGTAVLSLVGSGVTQSPTSGSAVLSLTATGGSSTGSSGTAALSLSATGSVGLNWSGAGTLSLSASGTGQSAASATGVLSLSGSGAVPIQTSASGALSLSAAGSTGVSNAAEAVLTLSGAGSALGVASGSGSLLLGATAGLRASDSGSGSISLTASGAASSQGAASGTAALSLTAAGVAVPGAFAGLGSLSLLGAGTAGAATSGTAVLVLSGTGQTKAATGASAHLALTASGVPALAGSGSAVLSLSASGHGRGSAAGSGSLSLSAAGSARARSAGSGFIVLSGGVAARAPVNGLGVINLTASGTAAQVGVLAGTASLTLFAAAAVRAVTSGLATLTLGTSFVQTVPVAGGGRALLLGQYNRPGQASPYDEVVLLGEWNGADFNQLTGGF